jgi:DHA1 family bicyclomycin/chloramphenicol resistance-like MFS transporter
MGEVAGSASAVIGTTSTAGGALIGALIDARFDGTILPHAVAFLVLGVVAAVLVQWAERAKVKSGTGAAVPPAPMGVDPTPESGR